MQLTSSLRWVRCDRSTLMARGPPRRPEVDGNCRITLLLRTWPLFTAFADDPDDSLLVCGSLLIMLEDWYKGVGIHSCTPLLVGPVEFDGSERVPGLRRASLTEVVPVLISARNESS